MLHALLMRTFCWSIFMHIDISIQNEVYSLSSKRGHLKKLWLSCFHVSYWRILFFSSVISYLNSMLFSLLNKKGRWMGNNKAVERGYLNPIFNFYRQNDHNGESWSSLACSETLSSEETYSRENSDIFIVNNASHDTAIHEAFVW